MLFKLVLRLFLLALLLGYSNSTHTHIRKHIFDKIVLVKGKMPKNDFFFVSRLNKGHRIRKAVLRRTVAKAGIFLYPKQSHRWKSGQQNHKASTLTVSQSVSVSTRWLRERLHFVFWQILGGSRPFMCVGYCCQERTKTNPQMGRVNFKQLIIYFKKRNKNN